MSKVISNVTIKLELDELNTNPEDSAPNSEGAMRSDNGRKRNRTAWKIENTRIKRQKELKDPCHPMLHDGFPKDLSELVKVELKEPSAPMLPKDLQENLDNTFSFQSSESDDESDDEFDPWANIFTDTYDSSCGPGRESAPPRSSVKKGSLTWAERFLSSV